MAPRTRAAKKDCENNLVVSTPIEKTKRISRLPKRFEDHFVSPSKFLLLQPSNASTPITKTKTAIKGKVEPKTGTGNKNKLPKKVSVENKSCTKSPDTNNNPKTGDSVKEIQQETRRVTNGSQHAVIGTNKQITRSVRNELLSSIKDGQVTNRVNTRNIRNELQNSIKDGLVHKRLNTKNIKNELLKSDKTPDKKATAPKRIIDKNYSFKVLEEKELTSKENAKNNDPYAFTFDPNDEPQPQKKKRKKPIKKKAAKPKPVYIMNNYKNNISKVLETLKTVVNKEQNTPAVENTIANVQNRITNRDSTHAIESANRNDIHDVSYNNDINYSPMASPNPENNAKLSNINETRDLIRKTRFTGFRLEPSSKDPLNLLDELNSFDAVPVACSSMNISARLPQASPWRAEFNELSIKWPTNTYIKPDMTPAVECSYINLSNNSKKHVYTNMVPISNDELPEIITEKEPSSNLKQSTMLDFIRETVEKSAKKRNRSKTPSRQTNEVNLKSPKKLATSKTLKTPVKDAPNEIFQQKSLQTPVKDASNENIQQSSNNPLHNLDSNEVDKENDPQILNNTENFFGFNDSENQENMSPKKIDNHRIRSLRSRSRAVLGEINKQVGPTRAHLPFSAKNKFIPSSDAINKIFDEIKSASEAPPIVENNCVNVETTVQEPIEYDDETNDDSVHLFEDLEVLHHFHQPSRKSYGKTKKVAFQQTNMEVTHDRSKEKPPADEEYDLDESDMIEMDLPFDNPTIKDKKVVKPKKGIKLTKKEEQEVEEWAAAFNSMCDDVEDFPLTVE